MNDGIVIKEELDSEMTNISTEERCNVISDGRTVTELCVCLLGGVFAFYVEHIKE